MTLLNDGRLGLGTSAPFKRFSVSSGLQNDGINIIQTGTTGAQIFMQNIPSGRSWGIYTAGSLNTNLGTAGNLAFFNVAAGSTAMVINTNNNFVGINTTFPSARLHVEGDIFCSGVYLGSDRRFKKDIQKFENGIDILKKIDVYSYNYRQDIYKTEVADSLGKREKYEFPTTKQHGVIAQELEKVMPEAVKMNADGYYTVNYVALIPILIQSVKNQQLELENLRSELANSNAQAKINQNLNAQNSSTILNISPNPTDNDITVTYDLKQTISSCSIIVYDINGTTLLNNSANTSVGTHTTNFSVSSLKTGSYFVGLVINGQVIYSKPINKF